MDESVLVIKTPENCYKCPLHRHVNTSKRCMGNMRQYEDHSIVQSWCPLRPLPRKIDIIVQEDIDYQRFYENPDAKRLADEIVESQGHTRIGSTRDIYHAWNACLKAITGETE